MQLFLSALPVNQRLLTFNRTLRQRSPDSSTT
jgi:hypothetical protein